MRCRCGRDHVPFLAYFHSSWWHDNYGFGFTKDHYLDPDYRGTMRWKMERLLYERFGDIGFGHPDPPRVPVLDPFGGVATVPMILGCDVQFFDSDPPAVVSPLLETDAQAMALKVPDLEQTMPIKTILAHAEHLLAKYGCVAQGIGWMGPLNVALLLRGGRLFLDFADNPPLAHHLMQISTETIYKTIRFLEERFGQPPSNVCYSFRSYEERPEQVCYQVANCPVTMISNETYEEFVLPYDNWLAERLAPFAIHHCGALKATVPGYAKVKNMRRLEAGPCSDLEKIRAYFPEVWLAARLDSVKMSTATGDEMEPDVVHLLETGRPIAHLAVEVMGLDTPTLDDTVRRVHEVVAEQGTLTGESTEDEPYWARVIPP